MLKIEEGKVDRAVKTVIYGAEGCGKSTLASKFPRPLFIDTEGGTTRLNVRRIQCNKNWDELIGIVKEVLKDGTLCETLVIDTADWAEILATKAVCTKYHKANIEDFGYGKGYTYLADTFQELLNLLDLFIDKGINVTVIAHGKPRKYELPEEAGQFDKWEMKLTKQVAPLLKEWCDMLLFCNYKTFVVTTENNTKKAQGGKRVMYTSHHPTFDAKNRFDLPDELDLDFKGIAHIFKKTKKAEPKPEENYFNVDTKEPSIQEKLVKLINESGISTDDLKAVVAKKGQYTVDVDIKDYSEEFIAQWIIPNFTKIVNLINKNKGDK